MPGAEQTKAGLSRHRLQLPPEIALAAPRAKQHQQRRGSRAWRGKFSQNSLWEGIRQHQNKSEGKCLELTKFSCWLHGLVWWRLDNRFRYNLGVWTSTERRVSHRNAVLPSYTMCWHTYPQKSAAHQTKSLQLAVGKSSVQFNLFFFFFCLPWQCFMQIGWSSGELHTTLWQHCHKGRRNHEQSYGQFLLSQSQPWSGTVQHQKPSGRACFLWHLSQLCQLCHSCKDQESLVLIQTTAPSLSESSDHARGTRRLWISSRAMYM